MTFSNELGPLPHHAEPASFVSTGKVQGDAGCRRVASHSALVGRHQSMDQHNARHSPSTDHPEMRTWASLSMLDHPVPTAWARPVGRKPIRSSRRMSRVFVVINIAPWATDRGAMTNPRHPTAPRARKSD